MTHQRDTNERTERQAVIRSICTGKIMQWQAYVGLAIFFWGISPLCQQACLKHYHLSTSQWQLLDTSTKVLTALVVQQVLQWRTAGSVTDKAEVAVLPWLQLPLMGIVYAVLDGAFGCFAALAQGYAIQTAPKTISVSSIVSLCALYPIITRLFEKGLSNFTLVESIGLVAASIATVCFVQEPEADKK